MASADPFVRSFVRRVLSCDSSFNKDEQHGHVLAAGGEPARERTERTCFAPCWLGGTFGLAVASCKNACAASPCAGPERCLRAHPADAARTASPPHPAACARGAVWRRRAALCAAASDRARRLRRAGRRDASERERVRGRPPGLRRERVVAAVGDLCGSDARGHLRAGRPLALHDARGLQGDLPATRHLGVLVPARLLRLPRGVDGRGRAPRRRRPAHRLPTQRRRPSEHGAGAKGVGGTRGLPAGPRRVARQHVHVHSRRRHARRHTRRASPRVARRPLRRAGPRAEPA